MSEKALGSKFLDYALAAVTDMDADRNSVSGRANRPSRRWYLAGVFVVSFLTYQLVGPIGVPTVYPEFGVFDVDSYRVSMSLETHPKTKYQVLKHPLFVAVTAPLFRVGTILSVVWDPFIRGTSR